ncbi:MAG: MogA/MoaB family molybdenum cofactor biosynthesis protein [Dehalococcoidia bacterium]|nr:MogA/MoaB family molybdenum cofactor biosynthesis protein [Dehalococcoidia bacterium]
MIKVGILTISDGVSSGHREDTSGDVIQEIAKAQGWTVAKRAAVPDERAQIVTILKSWADTLKLDMILTTGGTGLGPRDVTPEATISVVDRPVPGIAEYMRAESTKATPFGMLSRGIAGARKKSLIVNLPGSPKAVRECLDAVKQVLPHGIELMRGDVALHLVKGSAVITKKLNNKNISVKPKKT